MIVYYFIWKIKKRLACFILIFFLKRLRKLFCVSKRIKATNLFCVFKL